MHGDRTNEHFDIQNLKQVLYSERNFQRQVKLIELVIPTTVTLPQEGLLMWDSHYLMGNFMLISRTDQTILSGYASLDKLRDFSPHRCTCFSSFGIHRHVTFLIYSHTFGNIFCHYGDFNSVLTRPITVWQTLVRVHGGIYLVMKEMSKNWKKRKSLSLHCFWLTKQRTYMYVCVCHKAYT